MMRSVAYFGSLALGVLAKGDIDFKDVFHHECQRDSMFAYIKADDLAKLGSWKYNFTTVTLNSQGCAGEVTKKKTGDMVLFNAGSFKSEPLECDTQYHNHGGKVTFWNMIQYTPPSDSQITRNTEGLYNFSCTYDMQVSGRSFELSVGHKVKTSPFDRVQFAGREGKGNFSATMELYKDDRFTKGTSFRDDNYVTLTLEQYLFIEVKLEASDKDLSLRLLECWATPSANAGNQIRHTLIRDGCKSDETVTVISSGVTQKARWKAQMFTFINQDEVWLHCDVQACNTKEEECETKCEEDQKPFSVVGKGPSKKDKDRKRRSTSQVFTISSRQRREVDASVLTNTQVYEPNILTTGPIINKERRDKQKEKQVGPIIGIAVVGVIIALAMIITIVKVLSLKRSEDSKLTEASNNNQITADWNLYSSNQAENTERKNPMLVY